MGGTILIFGLRNKSDEHEKCHSHTIVSAYENEGLHNLEFSNKANKITFKHILYQGRIMKNLELFCTSSTNVEKLRSFGHARYYDCNGLFSAKFLSMEHSENNIFTQSGLIENEVEPEVF